MKMTTKEKEWHLINEDGEHITVPYSQTSDIDNKAYSLDVEWYQNNGYVTREQHDEHIREISNNYNATKDKDI